MEDRTLLSASPTAEIFLLGKPNSGPTYQWDMTKIQAPAVWNSNALNPTGSLKVVVGDIDTGIDYTHIDLYKNVWINQSEIPSSRAVVDYDGDGLITFWDLNDSRNQGNGKIKDLNGNNRIDAGDILTPMTKLNGLDTGMGGWADGFDNSANGFIDDLIGWDFINNDNNPFDDNGHGTHTAGTIGAMGGNGVGIDGVNWKVQIMALKIMDANGGGNLEDAAEAINYARENGAQITNNSWGVYYELETPAGTEFGYLYDAIKGPDGSAPVLFVAAAGNNGINNDTHWARNFPSTYDLPNIIAVAATSSNDAKPVWSNYGPTTVDLGAPGNRVLSTVPGGYANYSGTSMATPHVAGAAALLLANNLSLSAGELKNKILNGVDDVSSMTNTVSGGRLNVNKALTASTAPISGSGSTSSTSNGGSNGGQGSRAARINANAFDGDPSAFPSNVVQPVLAFEIVFLTTPTRFVETPAPFVAVYNRPTAVAQPRAASSHGGFDFLSSPSSTMVENSVPEPAPEVVPFDWPLEDADRMPAPASTAMFFAPAVEIQAAPTTELLGNAAAPVCDTSVNAIPAGDAEPAPRGLVARTLDNLIWLAGAVLFVTHGAFLARTRETTLAQEEKPRNDSRA